MLLLHVVEDTTCGCEVVENILDKFERDTTLGNHLHNVCRTDKFSVHLRQFLRQLLYDGDSHFRKLADFTCAKVTCSTNLSIGKDYAVHSNTETYGNVSKTLCGIKQLVITDFVCRKLFGVFRQIKNLYRRRKCKSLDFREQSISVLLALKDSTERYSLKFKLRSNLSYRCEEVVYLAYRIVNSHALDEAFNIRCTFPN